MSIGQALLPEYDIEMANTRKVLERIPEDKFDWKAHAKSNTIGWVAAHVANIPSWTSITLTSDSLDVAPPGGEPYRTPPATSVPGLLAEFDKNVAAGRAALQTTGDEEFFKPWSLLAGGQTIFTLPR
ncbi:MAG TPA: DinB family protein, partial [Gemmatales bacterium]|nr:DinB family protein [Gemmatales bacterium]